MLITVLFKLREHGVLWCFKRTIREFWHPRFRFIQRLAPINLLIYWPFAQIAKVVDRYTALGLEDAKQTVYVFYDLDVSPITYDYCWALALAELKRKELGLKYVHMVLVPGSNNGLRKEEQSYDKVVNHSARRWRIYNLLLPMLDFLPCTKGLTVCIDRKQTAFISSHAKHVVPDWYCESLPNTCTFKKELSQGRDFKVFSATEQGLTHVDEWLNSFVRGRKVVTITVREYDYMAARNSNLPEWRRFAASLDRQQYAVVLVPDTNRAWMESEHGFSDCHSFIPATWNLHLRMALYERAFLNLGINSGPLSLCFLNEKCNYICFRLQTDGVAQTSQEFLNWLGFKMGEDLPFAGSTQRWIWEDDTYEVIKREFDLMCEKIACNKKL